MLNKIGYVKSIDYDGLIKELEPLDRDARLKKYWQNSLYDISRIQLDNGLTIGNIDNVLIPDSFNHSAQSQLEGSLRELEKIKKAQHHAELFNTKFEVKYIDNNYIAFSYASSDSVILPKRFVDYEPVKNYDDLTRAEMARLTSGQAKEDLTQSLAEFNNTSKSQLSAELQAKKDALTVAQKEAEDKIKEYKQELDKKLREFEAQQEASLANLKERVEALKDEVFILENTIFALRSYFGETFSLVQVLKGANAASDVPLIVYQKFRYMDEDLARLSANSGFATDQIGITELFEQYGELFADTFCPSPRCITFFKASKTGTSCSYDKPNDCIVELEYYHGNQIGMLLRNGENLWLAFIDEEITLKDNLFLSQAVTDETAVDVSGEVKLSVRDKSLRPGLARVHIFGILDALLRLSVIYPDLKGQQVQNNSHIIFSSADGQIATHTYPTFKEFYKQSLPENFEHKVGDPIFIFESHAGSKLESGWGGSYSEVHRGVGYRNTVRDADLEQGIAKLNLITKERDGFLCKNDESEQWWKHISSEQDAAQYKIVKPYFNIYYYVSCERVLWYADENKHNNANVRIYSDEFMNLNWLNSNYVQEWIDSKEVPDYNYTYYVKKLKELKEFLQKREKDEFCLINKYVTFSYNKENNDKLLSWKVANQVRIITDFQAKRFVKTL